MRTRLAALAAAAVVLTPLAALASPASPPAAPAPRAASDRAPGLEGIPRFRHVVVLTEENSAETSSFGPGSPATYLNALRSRGVFLPNYYGTGHASLDNYIAMVSGQPDNPLTASDCAAVSLYTCAQAQTLQSGGRHLGDQLDEVHATWKAYADGAPTACFHGPYTPGDPQPDPYQGNSRTAPAYDYADRHNPFLYFPNVVGDPARCAQHQVPLSSLADDLQGDTLPAFSFLTPDTCHDGHDNPCSDGRPGGLVSADAWLREQVPALLRYLDRHDGLLVINFDENDFRPGACPGCASGGLGGQTGALLLSRRLPGGTTVNTSYDHLSLLRTLEDSFGVSEHLNLAAQAAPMTDAFVGYRSGEDRSDRVRRHAR